MVAERMDRRSRGELVRLETRVRRDETSEALGRIVLLTGRGHLSVVAERPELSLHTFGEIRSIASRRLRQLDGGSDAA